MFNMRDFILKMLDEGIGKEPDYKVRENALKWYERGTLVQADLEAIDNLIEERNKPIEEQVSKETSDDVVPYEMVNEEHKTLSDEPLF